MNTRASWRSSWPWWLGWFLAVVLVAVILAAVFNLLSDRLINLFSAGAAGVVGLVTYF